MHDDTRARTEPLVTAPTVDAVVGENTPSARSVWPFFVVALLLLVAGQVTFYVIAFSADSDELITPASPTGEAEPAR